MGRKIPGKKHRGVKDPLEQKAKRELSLAPKINAPPLNPDEQEMPKSLQHLMHLKQLTKEGKFDKKKRKRNRKKNQLINTAKLMGREIMLPGMTKPDRPMPVLVQQPGEPDIKFLYRVSHATHNLINEIQFEDKHQIAVKRDKTTGEILSVEKQEQDPVDAMFEKKLKQLKTVKKGKNKIKKGDDDNAVLSKTARRKLRKEQRKAERLNNAEEESFVNFKKPKKDREEGFERFRDEIKFGETVHGPPKLTAVPKKAVSTEAVVRPGMKNNLLLKDLFKQNTPENGRTVKTNLTNLSGKRKNLSMADRRMLEVERNKAIDAYKLLKANRKQQGR